MSMVKMVEPLLNTDAMEDMRAARTAAQITPISGDGMTDIINAGKAVLGSARTASLMTLLIMPGTSMMKGRSSLSMQASRIPPCTRRQSELKSSNVAISPGCGASRERTTRAAR